MSVETKINAKSNKDEKCVLNKKLYSATIRLTVSLREPDEETCSVFNYISLIAEEKRNRKHEKEKEKLSINGAFEENEEVDDEVKKLAQHFEEKYGGGNTKKKKKKKAPTFYNYTELAAGYDENDSFIDNSEAFDEALPDEMETIHGGYYVNCGQLEFKKVELGEDTSEFEEIRVGKKRIGALKSDDSDSEDDSGKSDVDKSESVDEEIDAQHKKLPEETIHKRIENAKSVPEIVKPNVGEKLKPEKSKENVPNNGSISLNGEIFVKKRKKYKKRRLPEEDEGQVDGLSKPKKKALTVKSLLEEKRVVENGDTTCVPVLKPALGNANNSINDVIESVVNAARNHSEDSRDSTCSSSDTKSIDSRTSYDTEKDSHHDEMEITDASAAASGFPNIPKEQIKLPDNLPSDVLELISQIKNSAKNSELGVRTFFNPYINSKLLSLEIKVRPLMSNVRHALYGHLSNFLPCSKDTLMKRAKKLLIEEEEKHMEEPFKKLKAHIDKVMPVLLNNYEIALKKVMEEKASDLNKNGEEEKKASLRLPSKKFVWSEDTRTCLRDLIACRLKCFHMLKPRKESTDDYVKKFLETRVKRLWPPGWMDTSILWKESHATNNATPKSKKSSLTPQNTPPPQVSASTTSTTASTTTTTTKKSTHSTVPSSSNNTNAAAPSTLSAANLGNLLSLKSLAMQYSDLGYPITSSSIPFGPDLNLLTAAAAAGPNLPFSMDLLSRLAVASNQFTSTHQSYSPKVKSPPKKQSPSPGYPTQRSTTPHSTPPVSSSFADAKKLEKMSSDALMSKYNDMIKIDPLLNTAAANKNKKEHTMLNHISQYNKHYSHKTEKRKNAGHERKESFSSAKTLISSHSNSISTCAKTSPCEVLDLSPNKIIKNDTKSEPVHQVNHHKNESSATGPSSTAKDHNYWSNSIKKDDVPEVKETKPEKSSASPLIQRTVSTSADTSPQSAASKPTTHISRKQRLLQESAKSAAQEIFKTSDSSKSTSQDNIKLPSQSSHSSKESTYINESRDRSNITASKEDGLSSIKDEKKSSGILAEKQMIEETANATDILSKIINDTLQNNTPLQPQFTNPLFENNKIKQEIKMEDSEFQINEVELHLNEFNVETPSQTSTPVRESHSSVEKLSSSGHGRKTPSNDRAEIEAADVINDLLALNQIGGRGSMRRLDYQDSRYIDNRHLPTELNFTNGSMLSQSSPHSANNSKTSSIPRMNLTGFQDEFLQHIFKMDRDHSSYNSNSLSQDKCLSPDFPSLEKNKSSFNHVSKSSVEPGNTSIYNHQSVIMPLSSVKWHTPEPKS